MKNLERMDIWIDKLIDEPLEESIKKGYYKSYKDICSLKVIGTVTINAPEDIK